MKRLGTVFLLLTFIAACSDTVPETDNPTPMLKSAPTEAPIIDLKITSKPTATMEEIDPIIVTTPTSVLEPTPTYLSYIISAGDTLLDLAARFGTSVADIETVNPGIKAELLSVGQEINIPSVDEKIPETPPGPELESGIDLEVIGLATYIAPVDNLWVLGAVRNGSSQPVGNVSVNITSMTNQGQIFEVKDIVTQPDVIFPGELGAFSTFIENRFSAEVNIDASVSKHSIAVDPRMLSTELILEDTSVSSEGKIITSEGLVRNIGSKGVNNIAVSAIFFNEEGHVIGYRMIEIENVLNSGESSSFSDLGIGFKAQPFRTEFSVHGTIVDE